MSDSKARRLLAEASTETKDLRKHLLVAAALREVLSAEPIVVGGTAEEFWTKQAYHETDLDLCVGLRPEDLKTFVRLGFKKSGRHWIFRDVAVEIPESTIDGDADRTVLEKVGQGKARIIGVDDLYLDRLRQTTMREVVEGVEFHSALAVTAAQYGAIDWPYVRRRIASEEEYLRVSMMRLNSRIRRRLRRELGST